MKREACEIAAIYKERWEVELFFKWIKQHLKINNRRAELCGIVNLGVIAKTRSDT
jgi:IS4 transposase